MFKLNQLIQSKLPLVSPADMDEDTWKMFIDDLTRSLVSLDSNVYTGTFEDFDPLEWYKQLFGEYYSTDADPSALAKQYERYRVIGPHITSALISLEDAHGGRDKTLINAKMGRLICAMHLEVTRAKDDKTTWFGYVNLMWPVTTQEVERLNQNGLELAGRNMRSILFLIPQLDHVRHIRPSQTAYQLKTTVELTKNPPATPTFKMTHAMYLCPQKLANYASDTPTNKWARVSDLDPKLEARWLREYDAQDTQFASAVALNRRIIGILNPVSLREDAVLPPLTTTPLASTTAD